MTMLTVFKATFPSINYIFPNGKAAVFQEGTYRTNIQHEIDQLNQEIKLGHPIIYLPELEEDRTVESGLVDPVAALRAKIIADYEKEKARAINPDNDMGKTDPNARLIPANSRDVSAAAAGGNGAILTPLGSASLAKLTNLPKAG